MANSCMGLLFFSSTLQRNQTGLGERGMGCHFLHGALYFFLFLLKERQTGLVERGMGGQLLNGALYSFLLLLKRKTYRARREREMDWWPTPTCGVLLLSTLSK